MFGNTTNVEVPRFYEEGHRLGNETRDKEFKAGTGRYYKKYLQEDVAKYMCGFLNSSVKGTLFIGVRDNGEVKGIQCDHNREDEITRNIDQTMTQIKPPVFPHNYRVEFVPVQKDGQVKANFKVIKIAVDEIDHYKPSELYKKGKKVYMKLDGSVRQLKPAELKFWTKQRQKSALRRDHEEINARTKLGELEAKVNALETEKNSALNKIEEFKTEKIAVETEKDTLQKEKSAIRRERSTLQTKVELQQKKIDDLEKRNKSKVCVVL